MEHSDSSHPDDGHSHTPSSSLTAAATRMAASAAKAAGYTRTEEIIRNWPDLIGTKIGKAILKIRNKLGRGEAITPEDEQDVENAMKESPTDAAQLLGAILTAAAEEAVAADEEKQQILAAYSSVLNTVAEMMSKNQSSLALKGFIHDAEVISYWHLAGKNPKFQAGSDSIFPSYDLQVYLISDSPTPEKLKTLNEEIRRHADRRLPQEIYDHYRNQNVALLKDVRELQILVERLPAKQGATATAKAGGKSKPVDEIIGIPLGTVGLVGLVDSMLEALKVQAGHRKETAKSVEEALKTNK